MLKIKNQQYEKEFSTLADQSTLIQSNNGNVLRQSKVDSAKTMPETDSTSGSRINSPKRIAGRHNGTIIKVIEDYLDKHKNPEKLADEFIAYVRRCEETKTAACERMKMMVAKERKEKLKLNQYISSTLAEISDYELLFVECVKVVKNEIMKRTMNSTIHGNNSSQYNSNGGGGNGPQNTEQDYSNIKTFLSLDKYRLLELFVAQERVTLGMYELMFPSNKFQINDLMKPIVEKTETDRRQDNTSNGTLNTSDLIEEQHEKMQGDRQEFNQSYHFENLMMLKKNKQDFKKMTVKNGRHVRHASEGFNPKGN
jgi:hypothetical protein